jgi:hypothetical protein
MSLPDTARVSLRDAIIWIAYGEEQPSDDLTGNALWYSREEKMSEARLALWTALEGGSLEAVALGPDESPTIIARHEWPFLSGGAGTIFSYKGAEFVRKYRDALYVKGADKPRLSLSMSVGLESARFTNTSLTREAVLSIWPPRLEKAPARGRPSIMDQIEQELDGWIAGGFALLSLQMKKYGQDSQKTGIAVARALEDWSFKTRLKASKDDEPQHPAIKNALRSKLRQAAELL